MKDRNRSLKQQLRVAKSAPEQDVSDTAFYDEEKAQIEDLQEQLQKARTAPDESEADSLYLDEAEWQQGLRAAERIRRSIEPNYVARVTDMRKFVDGVSDEPGIYWSPLEKAAFRARYADWYQRNK